MIPFTIGRLTQSEYEQENRADNGEMETNDKQKDSKDSSSNDFDFDEDFDTDLTKMNPLTKKKATPGKLNVRVWMC